MAQTYLGGCQCGKVRYEVLMDFGEVIACNCSRCGRLGSLLAFAPANQLISAAPRTAGSGRNLRTRRKTFAERRCVVGSRKSVAHRPHGHCAPKERISARQTANDRCPVLPCPPHQKVARLSDPEPAA
jgi:hypothetical protein